MARARYNSMALTRSGVVVNTVPNAEITLYEAGTTTPLADTIYAAATGGTTLTNPFFADGDGNFTFYLDTPKSVKVVMTGVGIGTFTADFEQLHPAPEDVVGVLQNRTIKKADGSSDRLRVLDDLTYLAGPIRLGTDPGGGVTSDPEHTLYLLNTASGAYTPGASLVDQFIAEFNLSPSNAWDAGAVLGVIRQTGGAGAGSIRGLAGQLFVYSGVPAADREAAELGVHNALALTSHADNPTTYDSFYGACGILLLSYGGTIESGGSGVRSNTAIVIGSIGGTNSGFKQAVVYYDTDQVTKLWEVVQNGSERLSTQGNAAAPTRSYIGFTDDGEFHPADDTLAWSTGGIERMRLGNSGLAIGGVPISGVRLYVTGGNVRFFSGAAGTNLVYEFGRVTTVDALLAIAGSAGQYAAVAQQGDMVLRSEDTFRLIFGSNGQVSLIVGETGDAPTLGLFGVSPVTRPTALTQTYATADATLGAYTPDDESVAYGGINNAQGGNVYAHIDNLNQLRAAVENLRLHHEDLAQFVNAAVDKLQTVGILQ